MSLGCLRNETQPCVSDTLVGVQSKSFLFEIEEVLRRGMNLFFQRVWCHHFVNIDRFSCCIQTTFCYASLRCAQKLDFIIGITSGQKKELDISKNIKY